MTDPATGRGELAELTRRWRADLESWAIPEEITAKARESPWALPTRMFARRADQELAAPGGPSYERAAEALPEGGSVLDVGAGAGAASLPLARRAGALIGVDTDPAMLEAFAERAKTIGVSVRVVTGRWPDIADQVPVADVVVCHNVLYNVPDIVPFVRALTGHARRRVVVQLTARHPMTPLNPLWLRFHGLHRPQHPTAEDAVAVIRALGLRPQVQSWTYSHPAAFDDFADLVEVTRRRLCLPPERSGDVGAALLDLGVDPAVPRDPGGASRQAATIWWDPEYGT